MCDAREEFGATSVDFLLFPSGRGGVYTYRQEAEMYDTFVTDDGEFPHHWLCRGKTSTVLVIHVCVMPEKNLERRQSTSYCSLRGEVVFTPIGCLTLGTGEQAANYST